MPLTGYKQGDVLCAAGEPLRNLMIITKGAVETAFGGHPLRLEQGDLLGFHDLASGVHSRAYKAATDAMVLTYPYENFGTVDKFIKENADVGFRLVESMCRQISELLRYRFALKREAGGAYAAVTENYRQYEQLCSQFAVAPKKLLGLSGISEFSGADPVADWIHGYYIEIGSLEPALRKGFFYGKPGISSGFLRRGMEDMLAVIDAIKTYQDYLYGIAKIYMNSDEFDLFSYISELHLDSVNIKGADAAMEILVSRLSGQLLNMTGVDPVDCQMRMNAYKNNLIIKRASQESAGSAAVSGSKTASQDSLDIILDYSECPDEVRNKFARFVQDYTKYPDRGGSDDDVKRLRKELTDMFYDIYQRVFIKSLNDPSPSTIILMFLNFGYVDAALAGQANADILFTIAGSLKGDPDSGVYTLKEWLTAIYNGQKEPSRNEFDSDYNDYVRDMKVKGKIDAKEETRLLSDNEGKLRYELENAFPTVNKLTFGRIATFCPLFADHNVQRKPDTILVTPAALKAAFDEILAVDFSAFRRETMYSNSEYGIPRETLNVEVMPDVILMPNVGVRGAMWQEIEGKKRTTPSRMFIPVFLENELKTLVIGLTAEFRWEMCRRIQGARWNDLSEHSLTSEFYDYLQFYKKNSELTTEARDVIKNDLLRSRNNFKTVFVMYYTTWLLYESNGSPRLHKLVRKIMFEHCAFTAPIRERLAQNPQYAELLTKFNLKQQKRVRHLTTVLQKARQTGKPTPKELLEEFEFAKM